MACWIFGVAAALFLVPLFILYLVDSRSYLPFVPSKKPSRKLGNQRYEERLVPKEVVDTVIIGSGQGGLSCGAVLSQFGETVVVCEQHEVTGGGTSPSLVGSREHACAYHSKRAPPSYISGSRYHGINWLLISISIFGTFTGAHTFSADGKTKWRFDAGLHITIPPHEQALQLACGAAAPPVVFDMLHDDDGASDYIALGGAPPGETPVHGARCWTLFFTRGLRWDVDRCSG
jgi:hypothetical protein